MQSAPLLNDIARGPENGAAWWLTATDGVRLRIGVWNRDGDAGTVLMFPGRTEYVEKYGPAASEFAKSGYCMLAVDWRGQGMADRLLDDASVGHVGHFDDYQLDVEAVVQAATELDLPKPWYLLGHSMGGSIGLRALMDGNLIVNAAGFSAPMWGILMSRLMLPVVKTVSLAGVALGFGHIKALSTPKEAYVLEGDFDDNTLTHDKDYWQFMQSHVRDYPELRLGGPSLHWLRDAMRETHAMAKRPSPNVPCLTFLGTDERIVDSARIHERMDQWPNGKLVLLDGSEHEPMFEIAIIRDHIFSKLIKHFQTYKS